MSDHAKHAGNQNECPFNAFGSKGVSSGWDRAHQRLWDEDQARSEWLWRQIRRAGQPSRCQHCGAQMTRDDECRRCRNRIRMAQQRAAKRLQGKAST